MKPSEITAILAQKYPNFSKITMCMISHPERYGVRLTADAVKYLQELYPELEAPYLPRRRRKSAPKKSHRLSFYVDDDDLAKVKASAEEAGCKTMQEYLHNLIK